MERPSPVNHVFIDFENVHEFDLGIIGAGSVNLTLLVGAKQTKLGVALVEKLLEHARSVQMVRLSSSGKNALDFALAYYVGRAAAADPGGSFHIISRDTGFDPLIEHLKSRHIRAFRHGDVSALAAPGLSPDQPSHPVAAPARAKPKAPPKPRAAPKPKAPAKSGEAAKPVAGVSKAEDRMGAVLELINKVPANRPKKHAKLVSYLVAHLGKASNETEVRSLIEELQAGGYLAVDEKGAITYGVVPM